VETEQSVELIFTNNPIGFIFTAKQLVDFTLRQLCMELNFLHKKLPLILSKKTSFLKGLTKC